jgi:lipoprotein-anchoring transpeptidase ErfK/SrfK
MRRSSTLVAVCAVAATVSAALAVSPPAEAGALEPLYANGSDVASPRFGAVSLHQNPGSPHVLARVGPHTIFGSPTRLAVVGMSGDWLAVISARLGNRVRGFVHRSKVHLVHNPYALEVDRSGRRLTVWRLGVRLRQVALAIGAPSTPTPLGRFSVTDKLSNFWSSVYGCCVLALSGRQTQLAAGWRGGDRLAIHAGSGIGGAVSNGCLRASSADMRYLLATLPLGTQVVIHA